MKIVHGYETPDDISEEAQEVLGKLSTDGVVYYKNDDGPGLSVRQELLDVAGAIGLHVFYGERLSHYELVLFDNIGIYKHSV